MATESLWPKKIELPKDEVVKFLTEQGQLLSDSTDGLLIAKVYINYIEPALSVTPTEIIEYRISPENGFLHSLGYLMLSANRSPSGLFPISIKVFPGEPDKEYQLIVPDFQAFVGEYAKIVKSSTVSNILATMTHFVKGYRRDQF